MGVSRVLVARPLRFRPASVVESLIPLFLIPRSRPSRFCLSCICTSCRRQNSRIFSFYHSLRSQFQLSLWLRLFLRQSQQFYQKSRDCHLPLERRLPASSCAWFAGLR